MSGHLPESPSLNKFAFAKTFVTSWFPISNEGINEILDQLTNVFNTLQ